MKNNLLHTLKYIGIDIVSASLAWLLFMCYRVVYLDESVFIFSKSATPEALKKLSGALVSQAKKCECGPGQPN